MRSPIRRRRLSAGAARAAGAAVAPVLACALLTLAGCFAAPRREPAIDLVEADPGAKVWCETVGIDTGMATSEPSLVGGWSAPSHGAAEYLWGAAGGSELTFRRVDSRAFRMQLRGWAHPRLSEGQDVDLSLNGVALTRIRLGGAPQIVDVEVLQGQARPGLNRLALGYPVVVPTGRFGRLLGPAWSGFRFAAARPAVGPQPPLPGTAIELPAGCGVDFFVEIAGGSQLVLSGVEERGGARLAADLECEGEPPIFGAPGSAAQELPRRPPGSAPALCRVTLRAVPGEAATQPREVGGPEGARIAAAGLVAAAKAAASGPQPVARPAVPAALPGARPSFLVYLVDALRADQLGPYGGPSGLTPNLDRFAAGAVVFERARAQSSWTRPAVASLFTGLTPLRHGATGVESRLPEEVSTLAERLQQSGYRTGYVTANGNTSATFGFDQGCDFFRYLHGNNGIQKVRWRGVHAAARKFFDDLPPATPYFLVLHTVEPHAPYLPSPVHRARWAKAADPRLGERGTLVTLPGRSPGEEIVRQVRQLYDAEVADADEGFGAILAELERRGRLAETSIVFLSDHGEELFDHGNVEHGKSLYEEQLEIPLLWSLPGRPDGQRVAAAIDQIDFAPTLLELVGLEIPPEIQGRSFAAALQGGEPPPARSSPAWLDRLRFHQEALASGGFKLIRDRGPRPETVLAGEELFDLATDPRELRPLGEERALRRDALRAQLEHWSRLSAGALEGPAAAIDDRLRRELQALGYLQ